ncbi:MAG: hypothetical protein J5865_06390, partial [Lachnospiraceae bacterium]|nr:hypothetical protein [Lachnospiraceae bacterium]
ISEDQKKALEQINIEYLKRIEELDRNSESLKHDNGIVMDVSLKDWVDLENWLKAEVKKVMEEQDGKR